MIYSHVALLMIRVFSMVQQAAMGLSQNRSMRTRVATLPGDVIIGALLPIHRKSNTTEGCGQIWEQYGLHRNLAAVIGPGSSSVTIATQNLLQVFRIPQIGFSATSTELSDKTQYKYFMRVVPSDAWQAQAIVDIVKKFGWTYIAVVYSEKSYGEKGFEELQQLIEKDDETCIAIAEKISSIAKDSEYDKLLETLISHTPRPQVAVCFCEGGTVRKIFEAIKRDKVAKTSQTLNDRVNQSSFRFQWIGSDGWADRKDVVEGLEDFAAGSISLRVHSTQLPKFQKHWFNLSADTNDLNPWWAEFWEHKFNCTLSDTSKGTVVEKQKCTRKENLSSEYEQDPKLQLVVNAVYTIAYGLDSLYRNVCTSRLTNITYQGKGLCPNMVPLNGTKLFEHLLNVRFTDDFGRELYFDSDGDPPSRYDILNYQGGTNGYVLVGDWQGRLIQHMADYNMTLMMDDAKIQWYDSTSALNNTPISICSEPCAVGEYKKIQTTQCCWTCVPCKERQYVAPDQTHCKDCELGFWPDDNMTGCYELEVEYLRWHDPVAILAMALSCLGIFATAFTMVVFLRHHTTPVVKATTRELSYIILIGIYLCYGLTFVIVATPSTPTCYIVRTVPGIAFAMIYGALLTKTNRIARILAGSKKKILTKKPRFLSTTSQVVITWLLVAVEIIIVTAVLIYEPARAEHDYNVRQRVLLVCTTSTLAFLAPFGWDLFLISLCTLYAVRTRNLPENFNEAKFIGFTMYTTCIIWLAFLTIYFGSPNKAITMCLSFSLSATVALVLLFFPKLYIIIFQAQKNVRSSYATTKVIRCHFGAGASAAGASTTTPASSTHESKDQNARTSSKSKMSSRYSTSGTESDSGIGKAPKRGLLRGESLHVPAPPKKPAVPQIVPDSTVQIMEPSRNGAGKGTKYHELSIIEESMMSHDETQSQSQSQSQSQPASLMSSGGAIDRFVRNIACQTDTELLEQLFFAWSKPPIPKRTHSQRKLPVGPSASGVTASRTPRRAMTERRHLRHRGNRANDSEYRSMVGYRLQTSSGDEVSPSLRRGVSESPLMGRDSSGEEEVKYVLDKGVRRSLVDSESTGPSDGGSESDAPRELEIRNRKAQKPPPPAKKAGGEAGLTNLFAESLGSTFTTFLGTAVPVEDPDDFRITTEVTEVPDRRTNGRKNSFVGESLESSIGALIPGALPKRQRFAEECRTPSPKTPQESPQVKRKGSVLKRIGKSIKRTVKKRLDSLSAVKDRSSASSPARSVESDNQAKTVSPLPPLKQYRVTETHVVGCPEEHRGTSKRALEMQDSDAADSGVILKLSSSEKGVSFDSSGHSKSDFDTDYSSKHSSAKSRPGNSLKRSDREQLHPDSGKHLPEMVTVQMEISERRGDNLEFQDLFEQQGLEAVELSESTLV